MKNDSTKRGVNHGNELPPHAYHPNISLRLSKQSGYISWPKN